MYPETRSIRTIFNLSCGAHGEELATIEVLRMIVDHWERRGQEAYINRLLRQAKATRPLYLSEDGPLGTHVANHQAQGELAESANASAAAF